MYDEIYKSMESAMWYGKKATDISGNTRYWKKTGAGVREMLKDSWLKIIGSIIV